MKHRFWSGRALTALFAVILVGAALFWFGASGGAPAHPGDLLQQGQVTRGDLEDVVSSTGTLTAVGTVEVGTQVSGTISKLNVDYNSQVKKGQVLATLDKSLFESEVNAQQANLAKADAELRRAKAEYERNRPLYEKGYLSAQEFLDFETSLSAAKASRASVQAALLKAQTNLEYSVIRSPINGTVIQRSIEEGQTVAASLSAPTLFVIAEDLSKMQIEAAVDESDIGRIKVGQAVRFTVQAHPERKFTGTVSQIRLNPTTVSNVVTYTVIVEARNDEGLLLPGMTPTADFIVERAGDVLLVPNAALQFKPSEQTLEQLNQAVAQAGSAASGTAQARLSAEAPDHGIRTASDCGGAGEKTGSAGGAASGKPPREQKRLYFLASDGRVEGTWVYTGATDGMNTVVEPNIDIGEGVRVVTGIKTEEKAASARKGFSLLPKPSRGGGPPQ